MFHTYTYHLVAEHDLTTEDHKCLRELLIKVFPSSTHIFSTASYYYAQPEYRLWMEDEHGTMVAHLDFERRMIAVNDVDVYIAGVGEVATHPDYQGQGLGRLLMNKFKNILTEQFTVAYGLILCHDEVVEYYQKVGWYRVHQQLHEVDIHTGETQVRQSPVMIFPVHQSINEWIHAGSIDLRGLPW